MPHLPRFPLQDVRRKREGGGTRDQDHVIRYSRLVLGRIAAQELSASSLTKPALGAVSLHGPFQLPADRNSDSPLARRAGAPECDQPHARVDPPSFERPLEIDLTPKPESPLHVNAPSSRAESKKGVRLGGEPLPALAAPVPQHAASRRGVHLLQEAVDALAVALLGLIGPLDLETSPWMSILGMLWNLLTGFAGEAAPSSKV